MGVVHGPLSINKITMSEEKINEPIIQSMSKEKSVFDAIPSKTSFFVGLVAGVMAFATIGFILLLVGGADLSKLGLSGGGKVLFGKKPVAANTNANTNTGEPTNKLDQLPPITTADNVRGDLTKAKVALIEYSDYECPFCKNFHETMKEVFKAYGNDIAWVYRDFPLSFHQNAQKEAEAAKCVSELGGKDAFWKFTDAIYSRTTSNGTGFALDKLAPLAKEVGVNQAKFQTCLDSGKYAKVIADEQAGGEAAGISGTPGTVIITKDGKTDMINGAQSLEKVKAQIDALLK
jgi:protein-disulfide isomerase